MVVSAQSYIVEWLFILGLKLIIKLAPYLIFLYVILLYTWMLHVRFHQTDLIIITANTSDHPVPVRVSKWNFKKVKWDAFQDQCITEIIPNLFNDAEDKMAIFSSTLLDIAADNILKTSPFPKRKTKPWFDEDCQAAKKERNKANRLANKHPSAASSMRARLIQARTKKLFKQKHRDSWINYVFSVNVNT